METEIKKWGNSKGIIIPNEFVDKMDLDIGDKVEIQIIKKDKLNAFGIFKGAKPFKREKSHTDRNIWL